MMDKSLLVRFIGTLTNSEQAEVLRAIAEKVRNIKHFSAATRASNLYSAARLLEHEESPIDALTLAEKDMVAGNRMLDAIKSVRTRTSLGLKEAYNLVKGFEVATSSI